MRSKIKGLLALCLSFALIVQFSTCSSAFSNAVNISSIYNTEIGSITWKTNILGDQYSYQYEENDKNERVINNFSVKYPVFSGLDNIDAQNKINATIKDRALLGEAENKISEKTENTWLFLTDYEVLICNDTFISIYFDTFYEEGYLGRESKVNNTLNFNAATGEFIELSSLFTINDEFINIVQSQEYNLSLAEYVPPNEYGESVFVYRLNPYQRTTPEDFMEKSSSYYPVNWQHIGDNNDYINYYLTEDRKLGLIYNGGMFEYGVYETPIDGNLNEFVKGKD